MKKRERRSAGRIVVKGAEVRYRLHGLLPSRSDFSKKACAVRNMSLKGLNFSAAEELKPGRWIELHLYLPEYENHYRLWGRVAWSLPEMRGSYRVGVRFSKFGKGGRRRNSEDVLRVLESFEELSAESGKSTV